MSFSYSREAQRAAGLRPGLEAVVVGLGRRARQQAAQQQALTQIVSLSHSLSHSSCVRALRICKTSLEII